MLRLITQDATSAEIVRLLSLSSEAVSFNYVSNIFTEPQVAYQTQAVIRAREVGPGQDRP